jgi:two-component system, sensor histidine kinase PdtaS
MDRYYRLFLNRNTPLVVRYGATVLTIFAAVAMQVGLQAVTGSDSLFLLLPGIFLAGLIFDHGSGLPAAFLATLAAAFATTPSLLAMWTAGLFAITAVGVAEMSELLRSEIKRALAAQTTHRILLQEMRHRTKNNLAILSAMMRLQSRNGEPAVAAALQSTARRIQVMSEAYDHLSPREDTRQVRMEDFLHDMVEKLFNSLMETSPIAFKVTCNPDLHLPDQIALAIGIKNELVTNALKYAFPNGRAGLILVDFSVDDTIELIISDNGVGLTESQKPKGLGSRIVLLLAQQLNGRLDYQRLEPGVRIHLRAPLDPSIVTT